MSRPEFCLSNIQIFRRWPFVLTPKWEVFLFTLLPWLRFELSLEESLLRNRFFFFTFSKRRQKLFSLLEKLGVLKVMSPWWSRELCSFFTLCIREFGCYLSMYNFEIYLCWTYNFSVITVELLFICKLISGAKSLFISFYACMIYIYWWLFLFKPWTCYDYPVCTDVTRSPGHSILEIITCKGSHILAGNLLSSFITYWKVSPLTASKVSMMIFLREVLTKHVAQASKHLYF